MSEKALGMQVQECHVAQGLNSAPDASAALPQSSKSHPLWTRGHDNSWPRVLSKVYMTEQKSRANKHPTDKIKSNGHAVSAKGSWLTQLLFNAPVACFPTWAQQSGCKELVSHPTPAPFTCTHCTWTQAHYFHVDSGGRVSLKLDRRLKVRVNAWNMRKDAIVLWNEMIYIYMLGDMGVTGS